MVRDMSRCIGGKDLLERKKHLDREIRRFLDSYIRFSNKIESYINKSDSIHKDHPEIANLFNGLKKELSLISNDNLQKKASLPSFVQDISKGKKTLTGFILLSKTEGGFINAEFIKKDEIIDVLDAPSIDCKLASFPIPDEVVEGFGLTDSL